MLDFIATISKFDEEDEEEEDDFDESCEAVENLNREQPFLQQI